MPGLINSIVLEGLRVLDKFSDLRIVMQSSLKDVKSIDDVLNSADLVRSVNKITDTRQQAIRRIASEYASWYVASQPQLNSRMEFWQPIYTEALGKYFQRIELTPRLRNKKFGEVVTQPELDAIIKKYVTDSSYGRRDNV